MTTPSLLFPSHGLCDYNDTIPQQELLEKEVNELFEIANTIFSRYEQLASQYENPNLNSLVEEKKGKFQAEVLKETDPLAQKTALMSCLIRPSQLMHDTKILFFDRYHTHLDEEEVHLEEQEAPLEAAAPAADQRGPLPEAALEPSTPDLDPVSLPAQPAPSPVAADLALAQEASQSPAMAPSRADPLLAAAPSAPATTTDRTSARAASQARIPTALVAACTLLAVMALFFYSQPGLTTSILENLGLVDPPPPPPPAEDPGLLGSLSKLFGG